MNCENMLRWVRGNDVLLNVFVFEPSESEWAGMDLDSCDEWSINLLRMQNFRKHAEEVSGVSRGDEYNQVVIDIPSTLPCGTYGLEFVAKKGGRAIRAYEESIFGIVEDNASANVTFDVVDGMRSTDVNLRIQLSSIREEKNYITYEQLQELLQSKNYVTQDNLEEKNYVTQDKLEDSGFVTQTTLQEALDDYQSKTDPLIADEIKELISEHYKPEPLDLVTLSAPEIVDINEDLTELKVEIGKCYCIYGVVVDTLNITLPKVENAQGHLVSVIMQFVTGDSPAISIESEDLSGIDYFEGFNIEANREYELNFMWNGGKWIVGYGVTD